MGNKGQVNIGVAVIAVVIVVIVAYVLFAGDFAKGPHSSGSSFLIPISVNATAYTPLTGLYSNMQFNATSVLSNSGNKTIQVSVLGYGCDIAQGLANERVITIPAGGDTSLNWTFVTPSTGSCNVQFTACFDAVSTARYSLLEVNPLFTGTLPTPESYSSSSPVSLTLGQVSGSIRAPQYPINQTIQILGYTEGKGQLQNNSLNWLSIGIVGDAYIQLATIHHISDSTINITPSIAEGQLYDSGNFVFPMEVVLNPVANPPGYSQNTNITISAGYTYCLQSGQLPVTVG